MSVDHALRAAVQAARARSSKKVGRIPPETTPQRVRVDVPLAFAGAARTMLPKRKRPVGPRHFFIPDTQVKPGVPTDHIAWAARYAASKLPETIVLAGDWYDMHSLSSYDRGKLSGEGSRYEEDVQAGTAALALFDRELRRYAPRSYRPRRVVTLGNHEIRISRAIEDDPRMEGKVSLNDLGFERYGWQVVPFLKPIVLDQIVYSHYFPLNANGRVSNSKNGAPSALAQVRRVMKSCVAGHRQGFDYALLHTPFATYRGVIAGSFYRHTESYLTPMGNNHWQGLLVFNDVSVDTGEFSLMEIDMGFLERKFG